MFPHLTDPEFVEACSVLLQKFELHRHRQNEWLALDWVSRNEIAYLSITKMLPLHPSVTDASSETDEVELNEDDDEVAQTSNSSRISVHYDVVLSPTYQVPVLYFALSDIQHRYPPTMETLYSHLIPPAMRAQTEHVGVIGGITVTVRLQKWSTG